MPNVKFQKKKFMKSMKKRFGRYGIKILVVGHEFHKDGLSSHLHVGVVCERRFNLTNLDKLFEIINFKGQFQSMKDEQQCIHYCTKDNDFVHNDTFDLELFTKSRKSKSGYKFEEIAKKINEGENFKKY